MVAAMNTATVYSAPSIAQSAMTQDTKMFSVLSRNKSSQKKSNTSMDSETNGNLLPIRPLPTITEDLSGVRKNGQYLPVLAHHYPLNRTTINTPLAKIHLSRPPLSLLEHRPALHHQHHLQQPHHHQHHARPNTNANVHTVICTTTTYRPAADASGQRRT
jgi:hypothetical protein